MRNAPGKLLVALAILIVVLLIILHFQNGNVAKPSTISANTPAPANSSAEPQIVFHPRKAARQVTATNDETEADEPLQPEISREQLEDCLKTHGRGVTNLLAAFHLSGDTNYLNEAITNFSGDPRVQSTVLAGNAFPDDRRKWLDAFKASSPSNSLANYLSAEDYFKNGNTNAAIDELLTADDKMPFENYSIESQLNQEDLAECSGKSPMDAARISLEGFSRDDLPMLANFKRLTQEMNDLKKQFAAAGDTDSVENIAAAQLDLADQIGSGDSGKYLINQLVSIAIVAISLQQLDPNTSYDFLDGETPAQVQQDLKSQKLEFVQLVKSFDAIYPQLTEEEQISYAERKRIYGELDAMKWLVQQHPQTNPQ